MWLCWLTLRNHVRLSLYSTTTIYQRATHCKFSFTILFSIFIVDFIFYDSSTAFLIHYHLHHLPCTVMVGVTTSVVHSRHVNDWRLVHRHYASLDHLVSFFLLLLTLLIYLFYDSTTTCDGCFGKPFLLLFFISVLQDNYNSSTYPSHLPRPWLGCPPFLMHLMTIYDLFKLEAGDLPFFIYLALCQISMCRIQPLHLECLIQKFTWIMYVFRAIFICSKVSTNAILLDCRRSSIENLEIASKWFILCLKIWILIIVPSLSKHSTAWIASAINKTLRDTKDELTKKNMPGRRLSPRRTRMLRLRRV
jgi:hypothetical protein